MNNGIIYSLAGLIRAALAVFDCVSIVMISIILSVIVDWGVMERRIEEARDDLTWR